MDEKYIERLKQAFGYASMAVVARRLGLPHATVRNYFRGRLPAPEVLMKMATETNVSINWLLIGQGDMYADRGRSRPLWELIDLKIQDIVEQKLAERAGEQAEVQELGTIDEVPPFDIDASLRKHNDPQKVMSEWFRHEGRKYPKDFGVVFFQGWETFSEEERVDAIRDAKKVLDRTLRNKGR